ncbi:hypothetical protein ACF0H5_013502 [Mactra antiquata]
MACCGPASIWAKIAFVVIIIGLILQIVAIATVSWMVYQISTSSMRVGLWRLRTCTSVSCSEGDVPDTLKDGNFTATQALEIITLIMMLACCIVIGLYCFLPSAGQNWFASTCIVMCFITALFGFTGIICWLVYIKDPYIVSYSMGIALLAIFLAWIAGVLLIPDILRKGKSSNQRINPSRRPLRW